MIAHVPLLSVEEFIDSEEFTYDTVCGDGRVLFENVSWYIPRPLQQRSHEWISPVTLVLSILRILLSPKVFRWVTRSSRRSGSRTDSRIWRWYRKADGEVVFGEIGARPPGAPHSLMGFIHFDSAFHFFRA